MALRWRATLYAGLVKFVIFQGIQNQYFYETLYFGGSGGGGGGGPRAPSGSARADEDSCQFRLVVPADSYLLG